MSESHLALFKEWRAADRQAHVLEKAVNEAALAALEGHGDPPAQEDLERAQKLRQTADDLFKISMVEMERIARANRR